MPLPMLFPPLGSPSLPASLPVFGFRWKLSWNSESLTKPPDYPAHGCQGGALQTFIPRPCSLWEKWVRESAPDRARGQPDLGSPQPHFRGALSHLCGPCRLGRVFELSPIPFCQQKYKAALWDILTGDPLPLCPGWMTVKVQEFSPWEDRGLAPGTPTHSLSPSGPRGNGACASLSPEPLQNPGPLPAPWKLWMPCHLMAAALSRADKPCHSPAVGSGCPASRGDGSEQVHRSFAPLFPTPLPQTLTPPHLQPHSVPSPLTLPPSPTPPPQGQAKLLQ